MNLGDNLMKQGTFKQTLIKGQPTLRSRVAKFRRFTIKPGLERSNSQRKSDSPISARDNIFDFLQNRKSINGKEKNSFRAKKDDDTISEKTDTSETLNSNLTD
mmetsp:Transcript_6450/g.6014  ORF Transcript_6450/g.6014 Transcript_6450/m.6014 type:complete len:103 (+) Transcript_6450:7-315(+)